MSSPPGPAWQNWMPDGRLPAPSGRPQPRLHHLSRRYAAMPPVIMACRFSDLAHCGRRFASSLASSASALARRARSGALSCVMTAELALRAAAAYFEMARRRSRRYCRRRSSAFAWSWRGDITKSYERRPPGTSSSPLNKIGKNKLKRSQLVCRSRKAISWAR